MPLVDVQVIKGVFDAEQKANIIRRVTDAMVAVEGEAMREVTWVRVQEINEGEWAIGGQPLTADMIHAMQTADDKEDNSGDNNDNTNLDTKE
jgi:4-oxalocrotonate tautomerase